ncbi:signal peptidase I [Alteromonas facilis]|uniref:signal peptidase I n=1 Tax=Alteromonas facilis TaxID=2048004 RepID=UPI000C281628|nr:signal peptidase I [Alteromonas facilis]
MSGLKTLVRQNYGFALFLVLLFACRSSIADWYHVPSGSMLPTIIEGDRIFVEKMAYRLDVPFSDIPIMQFGTPQRGDIVTFESSAANERLIKRIIGLPGDKVAMLNNQLFINGQLQPQEGQGTDRLEHLFQREHALRVTDSPSELSSFPVVTVPEGQYLVLGDNRNHSADSRVYGFIPLEEISGRAVLVITSLDLDNYYLPRADRWFASLM